MCLLSIIKLMLDRNKVFYNITFSHVNYLFYHFINKKYNIHVIGTFYCAFYSFINFLNFIFHIRLNNVFFSNTSN